MRQYVSDIYTQKVFSVWSNAAVVLTSLFIKLIQIFASLSPP